LTPDPSLPPLGKKVWGDTSIRIPRNDAPDASVSYRNLFTGERIRPVSIEGVSSLPAEEVFHLFPVALLEKIVD
jgi:maltooligosyltrehalose synthase